MDGSKVKAIIDWEAPSNVKERRFFVGLPNYYHRFIKGFSAIVASLIELLKKDQGWAWSHLCQNAFNNLKKAITERLVLALPDTNKPFEI